MSKPHRHGDETLKIQSQQAVSSPSPAPPPPATAPDFKQPKAMPLIPDYKRCPICFGGRGGVGVDNGSYAPKNLVYLKCNQCGHSWSAEVIVKVDVVRVDYRVPEGIVTR